MSANEKQPLVQVKNLCKYFQINRHATLKAVDNMTFDIYKGETVSLVGESGCGKSTTGRCMIKLYQPTKGEVFYDGKDIFKLSHAEKRDFCNKVQMIFQNPYSSLNPRMTVKEIVGEGLKQQGIPQKEIDERVEKLLKMVGLNKDHMSRFPHEFSGGQRQRIGIARALSMEPEFIICDEPISALDVSIQAQVINMLKELQESLGLTYLFIAHDLSVVKYISDRVIVMYLGTMVETAETGASVGNTRGGSDQGQGQSENRDQGRDSKPDQSEKLLPLCRTLPICDRAVLQGNAETARSVARTSGGVSFNVVFLLKGDGGFLEIPRPLSKIIP